MKRNQTILNALYKEFDMKALASTGICTALTAFMLMLVPLIMPGDAAAAAGTITLCTDCHGNPPVDSATRDIAAGTFAGNHGTHSFNSNCTKCHNTAVGTGHSFKSQVNGVNYINMTSVINNSPKAGAKYNSASNKIAQTATPSFQTCSNVNCHFEATTPSWGQSTTWGSTKTANNNDANCAQCHQSTGLTSGAHAKHITAGGGTQTSCAKCHPDYNSAAGTAAYTHATSAVRAVSVNMSAAPNLGGTYAGGRTGNNFLPSKAVAASGTCSSTYCHSPGTLSTGYAAPKVAAVWNNSLTCAGCHDANTTSTTLTSKHLTHVGGGSNYAINCRKCHAATVSNTMTIATVANHVNKSVEVSFQNASGAVSGTYLGTSTPYSRAASAVPANAYCGNTYCHSQGRSSSNFSSAAFKTMSTPSWSSTFTLPTGTRACSACHGGDSTNNGIQRQITSIAHRPHVGGYVSSVYNFGCADCHNLTASSNTVIADKSKHANFVKNVDMSGTYGGAYSASGTVAGSATGNCTNVYCHSDGRTGAKTYVSQAWNNTALTCTGCHGNATTAGTAGTQLSGRHDSHVNNASYLGSNFGCVDCHASVVSSDTNIIDRSKHVNTLVNYSGLRAGRTASCANFYCHSNGKLGTAVNAYATPPAWTTTAAALSCKSCHGINTGGFTSTAGEPNYASGAAGSVTANSHQKHVGSILATAQTACQNCHRLTTTTGTSIITGSVDHIDSTIDARFKRPNTFTNYSGIYNKATRGCSSTYCHGGNTPVWGNNNTLGCSSCHSSLKGDAGFANNAHVLHVGSAVQARFDVVSGNVSSTTVYRFGCAACHDPRNSTVAHAQGPVSALQSGTVFFAFTTAGKTVAYNAGGATTNYDSTSFGWTSGGNTSCNTSYCHSNGKTGTSFAAGTAVTWNTSTSSGSCTICHGNATSNTLTTPHASHVNNSAVLGLGQTIAAIGCVDCHARTVSNDTTVSNKNLHINKMRDYSGAKAGKGSTYTTAGGCTATYCHSSGKKGVSGVTEPTAPKWDSTALGCTGCHGVGSTYGQPNYTTGGSGTASANTHSGHVTAATDCYSCHRRTVNATGTTLRNYSSRHLDGTIDVNFPTTIGGTYDAASTHKCSTTSCHGSLSPAWGVVTTVNTCTKCHGTATATVTGSNYNVTAPPNAVDGSAGTVTNNISNNPKVGAHQAHLTYVNSFSNYSTSDRTFMCKNCHGITLPSSGSHANGSSAPLFTDGAKMANNQNGMTPTWNASNLTCANTYCHNPAGSGGTLNTGNVGTKTFMSWTSSTYLTSGVKNEANCNKCHKSPGATAGTITISGTDHSTVTIDQDCSGCHGHNGNTIDTQNKPGSRHMDGKKYGGGGTSCDGCHDYDTVGTTWGTVKGTNYAAYVGVNESIGAHAKHINYLKTRWGVTLSATGDYASDYGSTTPNSPQSKVCGTCHSNNKLNHQNGNSNRSINFGDGTQTVNGIPMTFGGTAAVYNGVVGTSSASTSKTCSNLSCHYFTTPLWSTY